MSIIQVGPAHFLSTDPLDFGPPPEWMFPHEPEPEVRRYAHNDGPVVVVKPCYCPLPAEHPIHGAA
jgi:hypothetical protein